MRTTFIACGIFLGLAACAKSDTGGEAGSGKASGKAAVAGVEVPGNPGFVVPAGGTNKPDQLVVGDKVVLLQTFLYKADKPGQAALLKQMEELLTGAGWKVTADPKWPGAYVITRGLTRTSVMSVADADSIRIDVTAPREMPDLNKLPREVISTWNREQEMRPGTLTKVYGKLGWIEFSPKMKAWRPMTLIAPPSEVQEPPPGDTCAVAVGDKVSALYAATYKPATVKEVHGKYALLEFFDADTWRDCATEVKPKG